jgi:hypothetical protein
VGIAFDITYVPTRIDLEDSYRFPIQFTSDNIIAAGINRGGLPFRVVPSIVINRTKISKILLDVDYMANAITIELPSNNRLYNLIAVGF